MRTGGVSARIRAVLVLKAASQKRQLWRVLKKAAPRSPEAKKASYRYDDHNAADGIDVSLMTTLPRRR
jgi:hypothetical protein